jgi:geranylgeranyl pyrophosphate synthase
LKSVPETRALREKIRQHCEDVARPLDRSHPLSKEAMETMARAALDHLGLPDKYVGWTMVAIASAFWRDQVAAVPPSRRLFLLPHCLKHTESCGAKYNEYGLDCERCGACNIAEFATMAEHMGYHVLVAEGSPVVMRTIISGCVDTILGVACLNVLEKAIDKVLLAGIPCIAVPLLTSNCQGTLVDEDWVRDMLMLRQARVSNTTRSYMHIMRAASNMFQTERLEQLAPRLRQGPRLSSIQDEGITHGEDNGGANHRVEIDAVEPIAATEALAYEFLARGGKYSRPFITLAVHDALTGGHGTLKTGAQHLASLDNAIFRAAMSIETFHKASLVHDDIEDDDAFRYGEPTLHRQYGTATAINVGDYLIGMGYRLVSRESKALGANTVVDILNCLADAHTKLCEGQGAELLWRDSLNKQLTPLDALKIYALKTAPAFEAAILSGARLAQSIDRLSTPVKQFARNMGVAFQILNDLNDWEGDDHNKIAAGGDILGGRPTILWALALEKLDAPQQKRLHALVEDDSRAAEYRFAQIRELYINAGVFEKACRLVEKYRRRAEEIADNVEPAELRRLFRYLIETVLEQPVGIGYPITSPDATLSA